MKSDAELKAVRLPYRKPQLEQVELIAEEAVLQSCKTSGVSGGPDLGSCNAAGGSAKCLDYGS